MRRVRYHRHGGPEVLVVEDAPDPTPAAGELLVRVAAAGVTLPSVRQSRGDGPLPATPGGEVVGRITALGEDVTGWQVGQRVAGLAPSGAYAEFATVPALLATAVPDAVPDAVPHAVPDAHAVALVRSGQVALGAVLAGRVGDGDRVLVTAAASGVGSLAVQLARVHGASRVIGAVSHADKLDFVRELGADDAVSYGDTGGEPVDVVLDGVGGDVLTWALRRLDVYGRLVAFSAGPALVDANELRAKSQSVIGFAMAHLATRRRDQYTANQARLWDLARAGHLRPAIHAEYPLTAVAAAHEVIEQRANRGKVIIRVD